MTLGSQHNPAEPLAANDVFALLTGKGTVAAGPDPFATYEVPDTPAMFNKHPTPIVWSRCHHCGHRVQGLWCSTRPDTGKYGWWCGDCWEIFQLQVPKTNEQLTMEI